MNRTIAPHSRCGVPPHPSGNTKRLVAASTICLILHLTVAHAGTLYVDGTIGHNSYSGQTNIVTGSDGPKRNVSAAINTAVTGDSLRVATGFYQETTWDTGGKTLTIHPQGTVTIYDSDPFATDTDGDGMSDGWEMWYGLNPHDPDDAGGDADNDGLTNLEEFLQGTDPTNPDTEPPVITVSPTPNEYGWFNTNIVLQITATDNSSNAMLSVTGGLTYQSETNDTEVVAIATDSAGNRAVEYILVNLDKTAPTITLDPGNGQSFDLSHPLLIVEYADTNGVVSSGLNLDSLVITLNGNDVTTNFHRFANRSILATNLPANAQNVWSARIADYAGNIVTNTGTFTSTGAVNTHAPVISDWLVADGLEYPDHPELWVQYRITTNAAGSWVSVNGGDSEPLSRSGSVVGKKVSLAWGTNVVVVVSANLSGQTVSRLSRVVRTDKYRAELTAPVFGTFANGENQPASGTVSWQYDEAGSNALTLASVTVNGVAASLGEPDGEGTVSWSTTETVVNPLVNAPQQVMVTVCYTNATQTECRELPLGMVEGYEIVEQCDGFISDGVAIFEKGHGQTNWCAVASDPWGQGRLETMGSCTEFDEEGNGTKDGWINSAVCGVQGGHCAAEPGLELVHWDGSQNCQSSGSYYFWSEPVTNVAAALYSLRVGHYAAQWSEVRTNVVEHWITESEFELRTNLYQHTTIEGMYAGNRVKFRAPMQYEPGTVVVFTLEDVRINGQTPEPQDIGLWEGLWIELGGQTNLPVGVELTNGVAHVHYRMTLDGGAIYTINAASFGSPTDRLISFAGFHNEKKELVLHVVGQGGSWLGYPADLEKPSKSLGFTPRRVMDPNLKQMKKDVQEVGKIGIYVYQGHAGILQQGPSIAAATNRKFRSPEHDQLPYYEVQGTRYVADVYPISELVDDFKNHRGLPQFVVIIGCSSGDTWQTQFTTGGTKLLISGGGNTEAGVAKGAIEDLFQALTDGKTVDDSLALANARIEKWNKKAPLRMELFRPTYGSGITNTSVIADILRE